MKDRKKVKISLVLSGLLAISIIAAIAMLPAIAQSATATRDIEKQTLAPGESTNVTVTIRNNITQTLSLDEDIPPGWNLTEVESDGAMFKPSENKWAWFGVKEGTTKTVIYNLTVPSDESTGDYSITGNIKNKTGIADIVKGEGTISVVLDTTPPVIKLIPPTPENNSVVKVNHVNVTASITDPSGVSEVLLNWSDINETETMYMIGLNTWSVNKTKLLNGEYIYKVNASDIYNNWGKSKVKVVTVQVQKSANATRNIEKQTLAPGKSTNVTVTIENKVTQSLILDEDIPPGWNLTEVESDGARFKPSENKWSWFGVKEGTTKTVIYRLTVPSDESAGDYSITGNIKSKTGIIDTVKGESNITVKQQTILEYYCSLENNPKEVSDTELLTAADDWINDKIVNGFNEPINDTQLLQLADWWVEGKVS